MYIRELIADNVIGLNHPQTRQSPTGGQRERELQNFKLCLSSIPRDR